MHRAFFAILIAVDVLDVIDGVHGVRGFRASAFDSRISRSNWILRWILRGGRRRLRRQLRFFANVSTCSPEARNRFYACYAR